MKNLTMKLSLMALVVLAMSSCKPKIDADFVNSMMGMQSKFSEQITALQEGAKSNSGFIATEKKWVEEMIAGGVDGSGPQELLEMSNKLMGDRASLLTKATGIPAQIGELLAKYKAGGLKLKDAKGQLDGLQGKFTDMVGSITQKDQDFSDIKSKFKEMYSEFKKSQKK